ncbi:hypothetical protein D3C86_1222840 [compost metagenome]
MQLELARANPCDIQQVIDDACLAVDGIADGIDGLGGRRQRLGDRQATQQLRVELDQVQRMLELVGHHREELILEVIGVAGLGQLLALLFVLALVAGQVPGNLHIALEILTLEPRHLAAAEEAAAILAQVPAFIFAAAMSARR